MDLGLRDKAYVVTGGVRGLGRATAEVLLAEGAGVVISGRDQGRVDSAVAELGATGSTGSDATAASVRPTVTGVAVDNADPKAPELLAQAALERFGRLDGVLISVGGPPAGAVTDITDDQWRSAFESVFLGAVRLAREFAPALADEGAEAGSITFVLSSSVRAPIGGLAVSNGLRPGLAMVAKTLADELGGQGVRVNGLMPGRIETERVRELDALGGDPEAAKASALQSIPLGRYGRPEEFGRVAAFLMSPAAGFISGAMIPVDGGMLRAL